MSSEGAQASVYLDEFLPCPLAGMHRCNRWPVQPEVMNQVFREHRDLRTECRNRCAGANEPELGPLGTTCRDLSTNLPDLRHRLNSDGFNLSSSGLRRSR